MFDDGGFHHPDGKGWGEGDVGQTCFDTGRIPATAPGLPNLEIPLQCLGHMGRFLFVHVVCTPVN